MPLVHIGRAAHAQGCINDLRVSRLHARVDWRNRGFLLTNLSSFVIWMRFHCGSTPVRLQRDTCILHGAGQSSWGVLFGGSHAPIIDFQVAGSFMRFS
jgi:pSer/pThr/pTyr-binding forkhead associated (FHA) protein